MNNLSSDRFAVAANKFDTLKELNPRVLYGIDPASKSLLLQSIDALSWARIINKNLTNFYKAGGLDFKKLISVITFQDTLKSCTTIEKSAAGREALAQVLEIYKNSGLEEAINIEIDNLKPTDP